MKYNGFVFRNSIIHKMNPSLKFLMVCFLIAMIFIPFGFIFQIILLAVILGLYFLAKLPLKKLFNIFKSYVVLMCILLFINWITYKGPGVSFDILDKAFFVNNALRNPVDTGLNITSSHWIQIESKWFIKGDMYGGSAILNPIDLSSSPDLSRILDNQTSIPSHEGFFRLWVSNNQDSRNLNTLTTLISQQHGGMRIRNFTGVVDEMGVKRLYAFFYTTPWYGFSSYAITLMVYVSTKIFLMILLINVLTSTTSSPALITALEDILSPLSLLRFPITEWASTIALGIRFIPSLLDDSNRIMNSQASRGLDFKNGGFKDKMFALSSLVVPLFSIAFKKAEELANAMEVKGFNPRTSRTRYQYFPILLMDWFIFSGVVFLFVLLICLLTIKGKPIILGFFGAYELIIMFG